MKTKIKPELADLLKKAKTFLVECDPTQAMNTLTQALRGEMDLDTRKQIEKARDEAHLGDPIVAEILLEELL